MLLITVWLVTVPLDLWRSPRTLLVASAGFRVATSPVLLEDSYSGIRGAWGGLEGSVDELLEGRLVGEVCTLGGAVLVAEGFS